MSDVYFSAYLSAVLTADLDNKLTKALQAYFVNSTVLLGVWPTQDPDDGQWYTQLTGTLVTDLTVAQATLLLVLGLTQAVSQVGLNPAGLTGFHFWTD